LKPYFWFHVAEWFWIVFVLYWIVSALKLKAVKRREPTHERLLYTIPVLISYFLMFSDVLRFTSLGFRLFQVGTLLGATGVGITAAAVALAIWARWHLGGNWSGAVTLKEGHELISSGPYRFIRHPIYTGILGAMAGTALALGELRGFIALALSVSAFYYKARKEERYLKTEFGDKYRDYAKRTGRLFPKLV
jgi:protein-S-isoprenylcysteine O-methyltransferase Ste14